MISQLVGPGSVIKVSDLETATPEKPSHCVLNAMKKSQMYDLMQHLGITTEGNPGSKEKCIEKIKAKWPSPGDELEISDEENSEHDNEIQDGSEVEGVSDYVDRAFDENQDPSSEDDSNGRVNFWNVMNYMPFFGKSNVEMGVIRDKMGNKAASKIQKVFRGWLVRRVVRKLKVEGKLVSSGPYHDYQHMRYVAFGQIGGGKRARASGDVEEVEGDPTIVKHLLQSFKNVWKKDDWEKILTDDSMDLATLQKMKDIMTARCGTPDAKAISLLSQNSNYVKIKVRVL